MNTGFMFKFDEGEFHVKCEHYTKMISMPHVRKAQLQGNRYQFKGMTRNKYQINGLKYSDKWHKTHYLTAKRIWEALYHDDWR